MSVAVQQSDTICAFRCGGVLYGLSAKSVCAVLERRPITVVPLAPTHVAGIIAYQGDVLTVIRLNSILHACRPFTQEPMLVLEDPGTAERFALVIDSVGQVLSVPHAEVERNPRGLLQRSQPLFRGVLLGSAEAITLLRISSLTSDIPMQSLEPNSEASIGGEPCKA